MRMNDPPPFPFAFETYFAELRTLKSLPLWKPPASVNGLSPGKSFSA